MRKLNLKGQTFGRLTVLAEAGRTKSGSVLWNCRCSCGNQKTVSSDNLRRGRIQSCGCLHIERATEVMAKTGRATRTHGQATRYKESPTYRSWKSMIQRTINSNAPNYHQYGGAGVTIAPEWMTFTGFLSSMGIRPDGTTLGRILDMGNYEPGNAFWQTDAQQKLAQQNKRALLKWPRIKSLLQAA